MSISSKPKPRNYYRGARTKTHRSETMWDGRQYLDHWRKEILKPSTVHKREKGAETHKVITHQELGKPERLQRIYHRGYQAPGTRRLNAKTRRRIYGKA